MVLQGQRIILRKFKKEDLEEYFRISNETAVKFYLPFASPETLCECDELIQNYSALDFINDFYFIIEHKESKKLIGALLAFRTISFTLDVSYFIGREFRGNEFVLESLKVFIDYLSKKTYYQTLSFMIDNTNSSSQRIMKKLGSQKIKEAHITSSYEYHIKSAN